MATSKFKNYFYYNNNVLASCIGGTFFPLTGIINFVVGGDNYHFTKDASIDLIVNFTNSEPSQSTTKKLGDIKDKDNIYTFRANGFPNYISTYYTKLNEIQIKISENVSGKEKYARIDLLNDLYKNNIIGNALLKNNNIFFRFSYDVNDTNCKQFSNCILYIEPDDSSNYTYTNWISPIASGKDISVIVESSLDTYESGYQLFNGSLEKCIKALDSTKWTSAFYKKNQYNAFKGNYNGTFKVNSSKTYSQNALVRFQDIDLSSIGNTNPPATPM